MERARSEVQLVSDGPLQRRRRTPTALQEGRRLALFATAWSVSFYVPGPAEPVAGRLQAGGGKAE